MFSVILWLSCECGDVILVCVFEGRWVNMYGRLNVVGVLAVFAEKMERWSHWVVCFANSILCWGREYFFELSMSDMKGGSVCRYN